MTGDPIQQPFLPADGDRMVWERAMWENIEKQMLLAKAIIIKE